MRHIPSEEAFKRTDKMIRWLQERFNKILKSLREEKALIAGSCVRSDLMEDCELDLIPHSSDLTQISELEFEIVNGLTAAATPLQPSSSSSNSLPQLKIAGDGSLEGLWERLGEMLQEEEPPAGSREVCSASCGSPAGSGPPPEICLARSGPSPDFSPAMGGSAPDATPAPAVCPGGDVPATDASPSSGVCPAPDPSPAEPLLSSAPKELQTDLPPQNGEDKEDDGSVSETIEELCDIQQDCTIFNGVSYLGSAKINAPKSETEIQRNMVILNEGTIEAIKVSVSIPSYSDGSVVLYDAATNGVIQKYEICRILFYAHGQPGSKESACFAFTWTHGGDTLESSVFQCHAFRCDIPEAVSQVSACFMKAFQRVPRSLTASVSGELPGGGTPGEGLAGGGGTDLGWPGAGSGGGGGTLQRFVLELTMEIKEDDGKGNFSGVPRVGNVFKLRSNVEKQVCLSIQQVSPSSSDRRLEIKRCFGVLIAPGRNVKHGDMQLLAMGSTGCEAATGTSADESGGGGGPFLISGQWEPRELAALEPLNTVHTGSESTPVVGGSNTGKSSSSGSQQARYLTVAVDLVIRGISEPVRLLVETQVRVYSENEKFWYISRRLLKETLVQPFTLYLKEVTSLDGEPSYTVERIQSPGEVDRGRFNVTLTNLAAYMRSPSISSIDALTPQDDNNSDGDEPMLSGTGEVSKECSLEEMEAWDEVLTKWSRNAGGGGATAARPRALGPLVRQGIPEALRGEVWQRLANCESDTHLMDRYRILITMECNCEAVIMRDINRTFPAHEFFKEGSGCGGQDALFRISKAYAVHDSEVGYCQGLSFLAATLLLHMPEEQAFCVLLKIMYDYGLRELYKDGFECLRLRLYQLNRLMEEQLPTLYSHFRAKGVESHMFACQWFLTLYTARFPLYLVFHIIDVFLLQGTDTLFQIALALLTMWKKVLLGLDFEAILKFFRVTLPKKCRNHELARNLMKLAVSIKVKKLKKYEFEFLELKEAEENAEECQSEMERLKAELARTEEERRRLVEQLVQVKELLKKEVFRSEEENKRNLSIIDGYKAVCMRLDQELLTANNTLDQYISEMEGCERCSARLLKTGGVGRGEGGGSPSLTGKQSVLSPASAAPPPPGEESTEAGLLQQRVSELELELAKAKLAQVEAECRNQDLSHKLGATLSEMQSARNSWPPWLSKTLSSIKEAAVAKATNNPVPTAGGGQLPRRESADLSSTTTTTAAVPAKTLPPPLARRQSADLLTRSADQT